MSGAIRACGPGLCLPGEGGLQEGGALRSRNGSNQILPRLLSLWKKEAVLLSFFIYFLGISQIFLIPLVSCCLQVFPVVLLSERIEP